MSATNRRDRQRLLVLDTRPQVGLTVRSGRKLGAVVVHEMKVDLPSAPAGRLAETRTE